MNMGKTLGVILTVVGAAGLLIAIAWAASSHASGALTLPGLVLGVAIAFIVAAPVVGAGVFLLNRGRQEATLRARAAKERQLLGMVRTQGQVDIADLALELDASRDQVRAWIYDLVDKGLFAGYTDWQTGMLYSRDAAQLRGDRCPNCGGELKLVGKGTIKCPFCSAEVFLTD